MGFRWVGPGAGKPHHIVISLDGNRNLQAPQDRQNVGSLGHEQVGFKRLAHILVLATMIALRLCQLVQVCQGVAVQIRGGVGVGDDECEVRGGEVGSSSVLVERSTQESGGPLQW